MQDAIDKLNSLIQQGVKAWTDAGELLVKLVDRDRNAFAKIIARYPDVSLDMLKCLEKIGRKEIHPALILANHYGAKRVLEMPYPKQVEMVSKTVPVVVAQRSGKLVTKEKPVIKLTQREYHQVFGARTPKPEPTPAAPQTEGSGQYYWKCQQLQEENDKLKAQLKKETDILRDGPPFYIEDERVAFLRPCVLTRDQLADIVETIDANKTKAA